MTIEVQTCEKPCVVWTVVVPRVGVATQSKYFKIGCHEWKLKLMITWDAPFNDERWTMLLVKRFKNEMPSTFLLTMHNRNSLMPDMYMAHKEITQYETEIWSHNRRDIPGVDFQANSMKFMFTFDFDIRNFKDILNTEEREHKSVQTPPYLDCLENLSLDLSKLMDDGSNPDVSLKCGDCTIPAHRVILGARSEVFRTMLQSDMVEGREGSVEIVDMEPNVFEIFIRYLYTGILPDLIEDTALALYEAADKYGLEALRDRCGDFLAENLTPENACEILVLADAHSDKDLKERIVSYVLEEKIPDNDEEWTKFCDDHPKLAIEVFRRAYKQSLCS